MSIDPLKAFSTLSPLSPKPGSDKTAGPFSRSFSDELKSSESLTQCVSETVVRAKAVLQLAQLQMIQGLFAAGDNTTGNSLFSGFDEGGALFDLPGQSGQNLDSLYGKYSLQPQTVRTEHDDIERLIDRVAGQVSLAPELIRSVVAAESDFRPDAVSPVGAQGLMQLMPETAKDLGVQNSFDPHQNLLGGSRYLKQLLDKYDGDLDHALAAYNWGQGNVDRHGLEKMPQETREYLARVKGKLEKISG